jgi:N-acetyltransferase
MNTATGSRFFLPVIEGYGLRLEPLSIDHEPSLRVAAADGELWKLRYVQVPEPEKLRRWIDQALRLYVDRKRVPFALIEISSGRVLGTASFCELMPQTHRLEIGELWVAQSMHRTWVNTACHLLMLGCAFDMLQAQCVGWRSDVLNNAAHAAFERLGARREGLLSQFMRRKDDSVADVVLHGMRLEDWPRLKARMVDRLAKGAKPVRPPAPRFVPLRTLRPQQIDALAKLDPGAGKARFVVPNGVTIANTLAHENAVLIGILDADTPVGMLLLYDPANNPDEAQHDGAAADTLVLWRLMVDFRHQGKGFGKAAIEEFVRQATLRPSIHQLRLSHLPGEGSAGPLFEAFGFTYNGEQDGEELVMTRHL